MQRRFTWMEDFLYAGSSALLWSLSRSVPDAWPLGFIALVPFLWRAFTVRSIAAVRMACFLAAASILASCNSASSSIAHGLADIVPLAALLILFVLVARLSTRYAGTNIVIMALLWLPAEYLLTTMGRGLGDFVPIHAPLLSGIASSLGTLFVSFLVILVNAAAVCAMYRLTHIRARRVAHRCNVRPGIVRWETSRAIESPVFGHPLSRGPPAFAHYC